MTASGDWSIEILPVSSARVLTVPGKMEGNGDEVIALSGAKPDLAIIQGNDQSRHFAVTSYGKSLDLLVNTTDPYDGKVIVASDTLFLEITATGSWSIEIASNFSFR